MSAHYADYDPYSGMGNDEGVVVDSQAGTYINEPDSQEGVYVADPQSQEGTYVQQAPQVVQPTEIIDPMMVQHTPVSSGTDFPQGAAHPMQAPRTGISAVASDLTQLAQAASTGDASTIMNAMEKFSKSQLARFMDITIIGPLLLLWAYRGNLSKGERMLMGLIGAGTVIYNGRNYFQNKKVINPQQIQNIQNELAQSLYHQEIVQPEVVETQVAGYY